MAQLSEIAIKRHEELVFLVPAKPSEKSENTILNIQQFINSLKARGQNINYEFIQIKENSTEHAILITYNALSEKEGHFIFDLSGGLRVLVLVAFTVALLLRERVDEVSLVGKLLLMRYSSKR
jgi:CRISPR locus-related DNA-binding protein